MPKLSLLPLSGVDAGDGEDCFTASGEPWLALADLDVEGLRGGMVEITYRLSLLDQPARPVIRFILEDGTTIERIAAAPIDGAGSWIGRMPLLTRGVAISPTGRIGRFSFRVEAVRKRSWLRLLVEGAARRPQQARSALLTKLIGWGPEADNNLAWAIGAFDLGDAAAWSQARSRPLEPEGLDRRCAPGRAAPIVLMMSGEDHAFADSLLGQPFGDWRLLLIGGGGPAPPVGADGRIARVTPARASEQLAALPPGSLVARLSPGDRLAPHALPFLADQRHREPKVRLFYGDEVVGGRLTLKPGWSPRLMAARPYLGRARFAAVGDFDEGERRAFIERGALPPRLLEAGSGVLALRRVLLNAAAATPAERAAGCDGAGAAPAAPCPAAAIIIPTADQPARLRRVAASIAAHSTPGSYRLVIVDNGGEGLGRDVVAALGTEVTVLRRTDAFNFSDFCNHAVAACDEPLLVFLNDDTEVLCDGWLQRLGGLATQRDVGAVGARLTYPDGRLQHSGVLVGMGGSAGHFGAMAAGDDPGWLGRDAVVHEVSAVTGACLAVMRDKFLAVGGFDAEALPVELSDVDLCLKLNARGWQTLVDPAVHLMHEESASRGGATFRRLSKYGGQRDVFTQRWRHVLRDDPFFHPGLSLYSLSAALG